MIKKVNLLLLIIFLMSFLLRLYFSYKDQIGDNDQWQYYYYARSLLEEHSFNTEGQPTAHIAPLYPLFLAVIFFFFGYEHLIYARIMQALLGSIVCLFIYFIAKEVVSKPVAILTFFFMSIHYYFIRHGTYLLSENLFIFLVALSILYLIKFCKRPTYLYAILFGLFCALATLTRSAYFLFPFVVIGILWIAPNFIKIDYKKLLKYFLTIILCFIFPISIWTIRNYLLFKSFIPLGTEAGIVLYSAYNPVEGKIFDASPEDEVALKAYKMSEVEGSRFLLKQTFVSIKNEPSKIYKYIPLKIMTFFSIFDWVSFEAQGIYNFSTAFILPLSFLGIVLMFKKTSSYLNYIPLFPIIYFLFVTIGIMGVPRTRLPIEPYLIIFAAYFVDYIYQKSQFKSLSVCSLMLWFVFNYLLYLNSSTTKAIFKTLFEQAGLW